MREDKPGKSGKSTSPDKLAKPGQKGSIELNDDEMKRVSGGGGLKVNI
jgi:hypothetical protein